MHFVSEHQVCGVSGRGYREFQGERYWFWPTRGIYGSQVGGKTRLLHLEVYRAIHGEPALRAKTGPVDGNLSNTSPDNWVVQRTVRERKNPVQELDGIRFYHRPDGYYYNVDTRTAMHRYVWERHHGPIAPGCHIHHKDDDKGNNSIANLEMLSASDHALHHAATNQWVGSAANKAQLASINDLAKGWHASEAGKQWHSRTAVVSWAKRVWHKMCCTECGAEFSTPFPSRAKYCHANCKAQALRRLKGEAVGVRPNRRKAPLLSGKRAAG